jgi:precorrin-6Y C5,15-methyltransferase (decarboxylating) CbiT subunit
MMNKKENVVPGIPDAEFLRGPVPMTKEEVRALTIRYARLAPGQVVWDIGAGSGSLTVEAARSVPGGSVVAVERESGAVSLVQVNCRRFGVDNVRIVHGEAPEALSGLPCPDRVLVGGSGGKLPEILARCGELLVSGGMVVVNALTPATLYTALRCLSQPPFSALAGCQVQVSRLEKLGGEYFFRAQNAVSILSACKEA